MKPKTHNILETHLSLCRNPICRPYHSCTLYRTMALPGSLEYSGDKSCCCTRRETDSMIHQNFHRASNGNLWMFLEFITTFPFLAKKVKKLQTNYSYFSRKIFDITLPALFPLSTKETNFARHVISHIQIIVQIAGECISLGHQGILQGELYVYWRLKKTLVVYHIPQNSSRYFGWEFPFRKNITACLPFTQNVRLTRSAWVEAIRHGRESQKA